MDQTVLGGWVEVLKMEVTEDTEVEPEGHVLDEF